MGEDKPEHPHLPTARPVFSPKPISTRDSRCLSDFASTNDGYASTLSTALSIGSRTEFSDAASEASTSFVSATEHGTRFTADIRPPSTLGGYTSEATDSVPWVPWTVPRFSMSSNLSRNYHEQLPSSSHRRRRDLQRNASTDRPRRSLSVDRERPRAGKNVRILDEARGELMPTNILKNSRMDGLRTRRAASDVGDVEPRRRSVESHLPEASSSKKPADTSKKGGKAAIHYSKKCSVHSYHNCRCSRTVRDQEARERVISRDMIAALVLCLVTGVSLIIALRPILAARLSEVVYA
ncbi:hypothetical protein FISHEDRAFT_78464 [Fistulina hepatica ATCC 64428]|nr:hypothetical protein FISHEDRAFT_78464 [Fistulina hepatica ATCC 64428]